MNERILAYEAARGAAPTCCWLRLLSGGQGLVALVREVGGNPGPRVAETGVALWRALAEQVGLYSLPLAALVLVTGQGDEAGILLWKGAPGEGGPATAFPWRAVSPGELAVLMGQPLELAPFWQPLLDCVPHQETPSLRCEIGGRRGEVWRIAPLVTWSAAVAGPEGDAIQRDLVTLAQAQGWVLARLAALAATHDPLPAPAEAGHGLYPLRVPHA